jgi:hypothetical protein
MQRFAYGQAHGAHRETIRKSHDGSVLLEQLSARFKPVCIEGRWDPDSTPNAAALELFASTLPIPTRQPGA